VVVLGAITKHPRNLNLILLIVLSVCNAWFSDIYFPIQVTGARLKLETIGSEIKTIKDLVWGLDGKMDSMEAKQNFSCAGVMYLCQFIEQNGGKLPERLEGIKPSAKRFSAIGIQGLQLAIESGDFSEFSNADSTDKMSRSNSLKSVS
jgi:hypothetical protein